MHFSYYNFIQITNNKSDFMNCILFQRQIFSIYYILGKICLYQFHNQMQANIHTIVIGAGIAGMAAASQLAEKGHHVVVLEASNYIGGRLKTKPIQLSNNAIFQYQEGANWIHGSNKNHPITQLSKQIDDVKFVQTDDDFIINFTQEQEKVNDIVDKQYDQYEKLLDKMDKFENTSVYDAFKKLNGNKLNNKYFMSHVSNDIQFQTASSIHELSAEYSYQDASYKGKQMLVISGYQKFAIHLSDDPNIKVLLNHQVSQVIFDGSKTIVKCLNGSNFVSTYMVSAVPIGVLKVKGIKFIPELPPWKEEAIQKIHFGNVCKILIILKNKQIKLKEHYIGVIPNDVQKRGSAAYFLNIQALAGLPALMTFGLGPNADELEAMPQKQLKELIASRLRVFGDESFTSNDFQIARSGWRANPHVRGAYSSAGIETKPHHWMNMAKPIFDRNWYFCGEHTQSNHRGTVHGAYQSGVDVAFNILKHSHSGNWKYIGKTEDD